MSSTRTHKLGNITITIVRWHNEEDKLSAPPPPSLLLVSPKMMQPQLPLQPPIPVRIVKPQVQAYQQLTKPPPLLRHSIRIPSMIIAKRNIATRSSSSSAPPPMSSTYSTPITAAARTVIGVPIGGAATGKLYPREVEENTHRGYYIAICPHCSGPIFLYESELACRVFRHAEGLSPHASLRECELAKKRDKNICAGPFRIQVVISRSNEKHRQEERFITIEKCGYI